MKIIPASHLKALDLATCQAQDISTAELMERAASRVFAAFPDPGESGFAVFCGSGNNGGDGWVIARLMQQRDISVTVYDCKIGQPSPDNQLNKDRVLALSEINVIELQVGAPLPQVPSGHIIVDGIFGSGLSRPISGYWAEVVNHLNQLANPILAIDLPSGIFADHPSTGAYIQAQRTFSIGTPKLAEFAPQNAKAYGRITRVDIDLVLTNEVAKSTVATLSTPQQLRKSLKQRGYFDHKGTFGHALIVAGSLGKIGAAVLASRAALRSGAGLVTAHLPHCGYEIMQISFPEAMCSLDPHRFEITKTPDPSAYQAVGVGPGIGTSEITYQGLTQLLEAATQPMVLDADALNIIARYPKLLDLLPTNSILTPHPKEFERLFGPTQNDFQRWELQRQKAREHQVIIILKGGYTSIALPDGQLIFNETGNPGMGTAGTGDVLTGILTGLLAQRYSPTDSAQLGVYLHGLAGDLAAQDTQQESLLASDVIDFIGLAFGVLQS